MSYVTKVNPKNSDLLVLQDAELAACGAPEAAGTTTAAPAWGKNAGAAAPKQPVAAPNAEVAAPEQPQQASHIQVACAGPDPQITKQRGPDRSISTQMVATATSEGTVQSHMPLGYRFEHACRLLQCSRGFSSSSSSCCCTTARCTRQWAEDLRRATCVGCTWKRRS